MTLKRNLIANYLGQGWTALMSLAFVPLYIKYLGIEAYGLIGLFAVLQSWLSLLDMGMTPTLSREMARFTGGEHSNESIRDLLRSIEAIAAGIAVLMVGGVALSSNWIASSWLKVDALPVGIVAQAFSIMGLLTALRFLEGVYRSALFGLQRQLLFNVVHSLMATLRGLGAVAILAWVSASIEAFFLWQSLISLLTLVILAFATYAGLPSRSKRSGKFSIGALRSVWRFAGGMTGITCLSMLLMQTDKILLSRLLSLSEFGYYSLASVIAGTLSMFVAPISQAWFPRLAELYTSNQQTLLIKKYHQGAQLVSVVVGSAAIVMIMFSETLLYLWTQDADLASKSAFLVSLLTLGNLFNGLMGIPYMTQLAHGWTSLALKINMISVLIIVPAFFLAVTHYGSEGAAWVWLSLNISYIIVGVHFMYQKILPQEKWRWYCQDISIPLSSALVGSWLIKSLWPDQNTALSKIAMLAFTTIVVLAVSALSAGLIRLQVNGLLKSSFTKLASSIFPR